MCPLIEVNLNGWTCIKAVQKNPIYLIRDGNTRIIVTESGIKEKIHKVLENFGLKEGNRICVTVERTPEEIEAGGKKLVVTTDEPRFNDGSIKSFGPEENFLFRCQEEAPRVSGIPQEGK